MNSILDEVKSLSASFFDEVVSIRRHFHQNPELSLQEHQTAAYIKELLIKWGVHHQDGIAGTGILATLEGENPVGKIIALRADMDALPIEETNDLTYKSINTGVMHACGHDVHMAGLLGAAKILHAMRSKWSGKIKLIFQPSEESLPGGASMMIKEGVLKNPAPESIFGQHVAPQIEAGKVGIRSGMYMASTDEIYLTVKGKGGHAAMPHIITDPVLIASHVVVALQQIVSRRSTPWVPSVLSFGKIAGNGRTNVIPDEVKMEGTFRTFDEDWRKQAHTRIREIASGVAKSMGGDCDVNIVKGYPFLVNNDQLAENFRQYAADYVGKENIVELELAMTAEDFAYYSQEIPACFYRLGTRNEKQGIVSNLHTSDFKVDEIALKTGMGLMAWITINELSD